MGATRGEQLVRVSRGLARAAGALSFGTPVACVYNPLIYARVPHETYLRRFGNSTGTLLLVGMNPGPWGMAQTGVPFGHVDWVRDWLGITGPVQRPRCEHPKRPVHGFECARREVSGERLWGWARKHAGTPERFFRRYFVWNYCPLSFIEDSGRNRTPDKLPAAERNPLFAVCDDSLARVIEILAPCGVVGIGRFAERRVRDVVADRGLDLPTGSILHPSPASPAANSDWERRVKDQLLQIEQLCGRA